LHANSVADDCSSSKAAKHSFVVGVAVNVLAHLHKDSAAQWGSATSTSAATKNSVDAEGRSLSQQCLQLALTGVSLPSQGNTSAASFICTAPSLAAFGPAQLLAVLLNKVSNIISASLLQSYTSKYIVSECFFTVYSFEKFQCLSDEEIPGLMRTLVDQLEVAESNSISGSAPSAGVGEAVDMFVWSAKALFMRRNIALNNSSGGGIADASRASLKTLSACDTLQESVLRYLVSVLTEPAPASAGGATSDSVRLAVATRLNVVVEDHFVLLSSSYASTSVNSALFWKQKLWNGMFPSLVAHALSIAKITTAGGPGPSSGGSATEGGAVASVLALCTLVSGSSLPASLLEASLSDVVDVVVWAVSQAQAQSQAQSAVPTASGKDGELFTSALTQHSLTALAALLEQSTTSFVLHLNIIMPALVQVTFSLIHLQIMRYLVYY
jgi:hypothetical protein